MYLHRLLGRKLERPRGDQTQQENHLNHTKGLRMIGLADSRMESLYRKLVLKQQDIATETRAASAWGNKNEHFQIRQGALPIFREQATRMYADMSAAASTRYNGFMPDPLGDDDMLPEKPRKYSFLCSSEKYHFWSSRFDFVIYEILSSIHGKVCITSLLANPNVRLFLKTEWSTQLVVGFDAYTCMQLQARNVETTNVHINRAWSWIDLGLSSAATGVKDHMLGFLGRWNSRPGAHQFPTAEDIPIPYYRSLLENGRKSTKRKATAEHVRHRRNADGV